MAFRCQVTGPGKEFYKPERLVEGTILDVLPYPSPSVFHLVDATGNQIGGPYVIQFDDVLME